MAKKKPSGRKKKAKPKGRTMKGFEYIENKCENDEQMEAALVYAVREFNKYFEDGIIVTKINDGRYKVVTFGAGDVKDHFKPVLFGAIKAAYEAYKEGFTGANEYDA